MRSNLQPVVEMDLFDQREAVACSAAAACGGMLYREVGKREGVFVAHVPAFDGRIGPYVVLCIGALCAAAERLANDHQLLDIVLVTPEDAPRFEVRPDGRRCWAVPREKLEEHRRRARAGDRPPFLVEFVFPREATSCPT